MPLWIFLIVFAGISMPAGAADTPGASPVAIKLPRSWNYQTYDSNAPNAAGYGAPGVSRITLAGREGDYQLLMIAPGLATCYAAPLKATTEQTETTLTIRPRRAWPAVSL